MSGAGTDWEHAGPVHDILYRAEFFLRHYGGFVEPGGYRNIKSLVELAGEAMRKNSRQEAWCVAVVIYHVLLFGTSTACVLFLAERSVVAEDPALGPSIRRHAVALRRHHRKAHPLLTATREYLREQLDEVLRKVSIEFRRIRDVLPDERCCDDVAVPTEAGPDPRGVGEWVGAWTVRGPGPRDLRPLSISPTTRAHPIAEAFERQNEADDILRPKGQKVLAEPGPWKQAEKYERLGMREVKDAAVAVVTFLTQQGLLNEPDTTSAGWCPGGSGTPQPPTRRGGLWHFLRSLVRSEASRRTQYDAFISYSRDAGWEGAELIHIVLQRHGIRTFFDRTRRTVAEVSNRLRSEIRKARSMIVVLAPGCLRRASRGAACLHDEIEHARSLGKKIVPVKFDNFRFPPQMGDSLRFLKELDTIEWTPLAHPDALHELTKLLRWGDVEPTDLEGYRSSAHFTCPGGAYVDYAPGNGEKIAWILYHELTHERIPVYLDLNDLGPGGQDEQVYHAIEEHPYFVFVVNREECVEACRDCDSPVGRRFHHALQTDRTIVPFVLEAPKPLSSLDRFADLKKWTPVAYTPQHFERALKRLVDFVR